MKISAVYKITNTVTGDCYIGSSNDINRRWAAHKCPSRWNEHPNSQLYHDFQKYGIDKFVFEVLAEIEAGSLKEAEQKFIETLKPTYNQMNAKGLNIERKKEYKKTDKYKDYQKQYQKTDKFKEYQKKYKKEYQNQLCFYNGETLTLHALYQRFKRQGIDHPTAEAKKYLIKR